MSIFLNRVSIFFLGIFLTLLLTSPLNFNDKLTMPKFNTGISADSNTTLLVEKGSDLLIYDNSTGIRIDLEDRRLYEILSPEQGLDSIVLYNKLPTELVGRDTVIISGAILNNALGLSMDDTLGPYTIGEIYECMNSIDIEGDEYLAYHKNIIYIYIKYLEIIRPQNIFLVDPISKTFYQKDRKH